MRLALDGSTVIFGYREGSVVLAVERTVPVETWPAPMLGTDGRGSYFLIPRRAGRDRPHPPQVHTR